MDLYALPPEEFTAARDAAAKQDPTLKPLRKPTLSAWVVNTLVRRDPGLLDELTALGASLADAQQHGQGSVLRDLGDQRRQLVAGVTQRALDLAGRDVSAAARAEVEATIEAALADPASAEAVRSGQLVRPLSFAGFGGVDLEGAVAPVPRPRARERKPAASEKSPVAKTDSAAEAAAVKAAALEAAALEAAGALDDAVQHAERAARAVEDHDQAAAAAQDEEDAAAEAVTQAREALEAAEQEQVAARRRRVAVAKEREALVRRASATTKAVAAAQDGADAARVALDRLRRGS